MMVMGFGKCLENYVACVLMLASSQDAVVLARMFAVLCMVSQFSSGPGGLIKHCPYLRNVEFCCGSELGYGDKGVCMVRPFLVREAHRPYMSMSRWRNLFAVLLSALIIYHRIPCRRFHPLSNIYFCGHIYERFKKSMHTIQLTGCNEIHSAMKHKDGNMAVVEDECLWGL